MMKKKKEPDTKKEKRISEMKMVSLIPECFQRLNDLKWRDINDVLVRNHFLVQDLEESLEKLRKSKNNPEKNKIQVNLISSGLRDLKEEIEDMYEQEKETKNLNEIENIVENILEFNK